MLETETNEKTFARCFWVQRWE